MATPLILLNFLSRAERAYFERHLCWQVPASTARICTDVTNASPDKVLRRALRRPGLGCSPNQDAPVRRSSR